MSLPKLTVPTYFLTVPSTKKKVKFRPFLSKEEKILMMVKNSTSNSEILEAMRTIIDICTFEKLNTNLLSIFDLEYMFLQIRAKSVGEVIEIEMKCTNEIETKPCGGKISINININDINVNFLEKHTNIIKLEEKIGVTMRYPSANDSHIMEDSNKSDGEIVTLLINNIFDEDNVYDSKDISPEEIKEFVDDITPKQMSEIKEKFFFNMPSLEHTITYKCPSCGNEGSYTFSGIADFF